MTGGDQLQSMSRRVAVADAIAARDAARWRDPRGPYPIGTVDFTLTDRSRHATYAPEPTLQRELAATVWYPARTATGSSRRRYLDARDVAEGVHSAFNFMQVPLAEQARLATLETAAFVGAPIAPGRFPLLVHCHGGTLYRESNTVLVEHLASHGYVVVSVAHPYESGTHYLPGGRRLDQTSAWHAEVLPLGHDPEYLQAYMGATRGERLEALTRVLPRTRRTLLGRLATAWSDDLLFVVDCLAQGDVPDAIADIAAAVDLDRLGYFGMSMGGHVAALCCMKDPRARAGANLDGGVLTAEPLGRELGVPFLAFTEDMSVGAAMLGRSAPSPVADGPSVLDLAYQRSDGVPPLFPVHRITVRGAAHMDFTDMPRLFDPARVPQAASRIPVDRLLEVQVRVVGDFFDQYVRGTGTGFPERVAKEFDDLLVVHRSA
jgi:predicted dienelactone hydrolase